MESGMSSLAMAGVAGTMKLPAVTEGVIDEGPDEAVTLASGPPDPSPSTTLTPLMVTEVGSPISMVAAPLPDVLCPDVDVGAAGGGTFGL